MLDLSLQSIKVVLQITNQSQQDKYTMDPGWSNLSQQSENSFQQKVIFEKKQLKNT